MHVPRSFLPTLSLSTLPPKNLLGTLGAGCHAITAMGRKFARRQAHRIITIRCEEMHDLSHTSRSQLPEHTHYFAIEAKMEGEGLAESRKESGLIFRRKSAKVFLTFLHSHKSVPHRLSVCPAAPQMEVEMNTTAFAAIRRKGKLERSGSKLQDRQALTPSLPKSDS